MARSPDLSAQRAVDRAKAESLIDVSRETWERLEAFVALLDHWQAKTNLVSSETLPVVWTRHVADSAQLLSAAPANSLQWMDLGSGGGFPGIVIACSLAERPGGHIHLVESVQRKAAFLREAVRRLHLPATVHTVRIEDLPPRIEEGLDVVTARAVAPLPHLLSLAAPLLSGRAIGLFLKGRDVVTELDDATRYWEMSYDLIPSRTEPGASIVRLERLTPRSPDRAGTAGP